MPRKTPPHPHRAPIDEYGRIVRYLRLSVTDRCNLRCVYCRSVIKTRSIPHDRILRYEELLRLAGVGVKAGIRKIRVTGGEPFVRKGFMPFLRMLRAAHPDVDLRLTTNGTLLGEHIDELRGLRLGGVNISLDSLRPEGFQAATGRDLLPVVLRNIDALLAAGINVKINAVALKGINDREVRAFVDFAGRRPVDVRFIEFMPMGGGTGWSEERFQSAGNILAEAAKWAELAPCGADPADGPARMYSVVGGMGRFGVITPVSDHFCLTCNRLRVTPDGHLRVCLFDDREYRLSGILRHPRLGDLFLSEIFERACRRKPLGVDILRKRGENAVAEKSMLRIGG
jgi:cyclic pyranopterin phosphate synthase